MARRRKSCFERAVDLVARRAHLRRELERKLTARGFDGDEVAAALDRLHELGYLDDRQTARDLASFRMRRRHDGPLKVQAELRRRGADADLAEQVVRELLPDGDRQAARREAERWLARGRREAPALARHLSRKGYTAGSIGALLDELDLG